MAREEIFDRLPYYSDEMWLALRKIGGSNASAIVGENPYGTNLRLWQQLMGLRPRDNVDNPFTRYGKAAEAPLRALFKVDYAGFLKITFKKEVLARKDKPFMTASLDGEILVLKDLDIMSYWKSRAKTATEVMNEEVPPTIKLKKGMRGVLEVKTTELIRSFHRERWENQIPQNYFCQVLHYLNVTGYDFVLLSAQLALEDRNGVRTYERRLYGFTREDKLESLEYLENEVTKFQNDFILTGVEPPLRIKEL